MCGSDNHTQMPTLPGMLRQNTLSQVKFILQLPIFLESANTNDITQAQL